MDWNWLTIPPGFWSWLTNQGITVATVLGAGYALFQFVGKKWLDARFAERLQKSKQDHDQEIVHLRFRIDALMDRTTKLHQHEFEVLPEVWEKVLKACNGAQQFLSHLKGYPNLEMMRDDQLDEFLETTKLTNSQKAELKRLTPPERHKSYVKVIFWHELYDVKTLYNDFQTYFAAKSIFIQPELSERIGELSEMIFKALNEREYEEQYPTEPGEDRFAAGDLLHSKAGDKLNDIRSEVQARLWKADKLD